MSTERLDIVVTTSGDKAASQNISQIGTSADVSAKSVDTLNSSMRFMRTALAAVGVGAFVMEMFRAADAYTTLSNRIRAAASTQEEFARAEQEVFNIAQRTRTSFEETANLYGRFQAVTRSLRISQEDLFKMLETVNQAIQVGGATSSGAAAGLLQFSQALAAGVLRGEEFNSIMENTPGLAAAIAKGLNVPIGALRNMAMQGQLTAKAITDALQRVAPEVSRAFSAMTPTVSQAFQVLSNAWTRFQGQLDQAQGTSAIVSRAILLLADNLRLLYNILVTGAATWVAYRVALVAASVATTAWAAATTSTTLAVAGLNTGLTTLTITTAGASTASRAFTAALALLTGALRAVWAVVAANPFVTLATAIAGVVIAIYTFGNSIQINGISPLAALNAVIALVVSAFKFLIDAVAPWVEQMVRGAQVIAGWIVQLVGAENASIALRAAVVALGVYMFATFLPALVSLTLTVGAAIAAFVLMGEVITRLSGGQWGEFTNRIIEVGDRLKTDFIKRMREAQQQIDSTQNSQQQFVRGLEQVQGGANQTGRAVRNLTTELGTAEELHRRWMDQIKKASDEGRANLQRLIQEEQRAATVTRNAFGDMIQITDEWAERSGANFNKVTNQARSAADSISDSTSTMTRSLDSTTRHSGGTGGGTTSTTQTFQGAADIRIRPLDAGTQSVLRSLGVDPDTMQTLQMQATVLRGTPSYATALRALSQYLSGQSDEAKGYLKSIGFAPYAAYRYGGGFEVGGSGGPDSQLVQFMATPGEDVTVRTRRQQRADDGGARPQQNVINVSMEVHGVRSPEEFRRSEQQILTSLQSKLSQVAPRLK